MEVYENFFIYPHLSEILPIYAAPGLKAALLHFYAIKPALLSYSITLAHLSAFWSCDRSLSK